MLPFDRTKHVFDTSVLEEVIKDAIRFFNGTPVHSIPLPEKFSGTGVYAIYYTGKFSSYSSISTENRTEYKLPIYVGKAVPQGWRQARVENKSSFELFTRINEHKRSIEQVSNLEISDFFIRFMILENSAVDLISTIESALIRHYKPLWNTTIDGFGNHDPGSGRYNQAKSDWDVLHPGRPWAEKCTGDANSIDNVRESVIKYGK